ncbi:hypothetical protein MMC22_010001 [Lobaria immixta]|nr:hypothetical protein [Lobaria immixta]
MDQLSAELISIVCSFLTSTDVGHLRCASKFYANVGRPFMYRQLHLIFTPDSFERLHTISSDPTLAPYVTSLYYEADSLPVYGSMKDWERFAAFDLAMSPELESMKPSRPDNGSERALRAYQREIAKLEKRHRYLQVQAGWDKYLRYLVQQKEMREDNYLAGKIADAMVHLPNLIQIVFSLRRWVGGPSKAIENAYSDAHVIPYGHNSYSWTGVPQMLSLLQGSARTQMKLKSLCGGIMNWEFFRQSDEVLEELHKAVRNLQELKLEFSTGTKEDLEMMRPAGREYYYSVMAVYKCARYLMNGRLREFLAAAPNLRLLDVRFDQNVKNDTPGSPAALRYVVGKHKWEFLADVTLSFFDSRDEDLVDFCEIHAMTLQRLVLNEIQLFQGSWPPTLQKMRRLLHLKQVRIRGYLRSFEWHENWAFPPMESQEENLMSRAVQGYLLQNGDGPLLDLSDQWEFDFDSFLLPYA